MEAVVTKDAPPPAGHYSQGIVHEGLVYVAGQLGKDAAGPESPPGTLEEQTERALRNVEAVLVAAGSDLSRVLQMTVYVSDAAFWGRVNEVYARVMGENRPARAIVPVKEFRGGWQIEIQAIAAVRFRGGAA
ncbi:MAG: Rid family hydrolase [Thermoanaerobaculia bacterium]|nr:Rid family hydrolase [Thermoanaerobaculia bacterium]